MEKTAFIYIHGVQPDVNSPQSKGYSAEFHKRLLRELGKSGQDVSQVKRFEVNWAAVTFQFKKSLAELQFDGPPRRRGASFIQKTLRNFIYPAVVDILYYVKNKGVENNTDDDLVMEKLHLAVERVKAEGFEKVVILAHSLGSVIAYDYIFRFSERFEFPKGLTLAALVTFGSPIPLFASGMGYPFSTKIKRPAYVKKWINLWDWDDGVAGRCGPHFPKDFAEGFLKDIAVNTAWINPLNAHQRYWTNKKVGEEIAKSLAE